MAYVPTAVPPVDGSPMTLNGVTEVASDSDGDGIVDFHSVVIREYEPFRCIYHLSDSDGDQVPDYVTLNLGDASREVIYSQYDGDEDGTVDGQFFALTANTDALDKVVYRDLNFDGWVDMISRKKSLEESFDDPPAVWVLMNGSLHSAREIDTKTDTPRARIASADGEDVWAFFEEGRWRINPDQQ